MSGLPPGLAAPQGFAMPLPLRMATVYTMDRIGAISTA